MIVPDPDGGSRLLEWSLSLFLLALSVTLLVLSAFLVEALLTYRACHWVFWSSPDALPVCLPR